MSEEARLRGGHASQAVAAAGRARTLSGLPEVGQAFGTRYHIIRLLGMGGMGAVYQAWDAELAVTVAIKVIRPEVMADPQAAAEIRHRFKRELLLARQVTHRNVVRIHDLGEINGIKYITMPYIDGADLATVLKQTGKLSPARTLRIVRSVVSGLVEAHAAGVVHRDLKPANIMIDAEDEALIMDFGIARSTGAPVALGSTTGEVLGQLRRAGLSGSHSTQLGAVVGTIQYMAPEQARGESVDQRADIYALGLIMYDMLAGSSRPDQRAGAVADVGARLEQAPPPPIRSIAPAVPVALDLVVSRCLAPDPANRYQTTRELAAALQRLDENGEPIRIKRVIGLPVFVVGIGLVVALVAGLVGAGWWLTRAPATPVQHDPVSVLIADFQNRSRDEMFNGTLEPIVKLALEGAGFITAYDRAGIRRSLGVRPPETLDERVAQEMGVKQGVGVILSGAVERRDGGYAVTMKAAHAVTGAVITTATTEASTREQVLPAVTSLVTSVRKALGDNTSDEAQRFAMDTLSATSLEAVRDYGAGMLANSDSRFDEARRRFSSAVARDPNFGMGWTALAMASFNLDLQRDAEKYAKEALRHLDGMTERERYRTRGLSFMLAGDYQQCAKEYGTLVDRYAADASARNNLALCLTHLRSLARAVAEMRQVVKILPNRALYRENLALYADYAGDFIAGEQEARALPQRGVFGSLALAFAQLGQEQLSEAAQTYREMGSIDEQGASYMASGLGDLALYEGRFSDAARTFEAAAAADLKAQNWERAAAKYTALAQARLLERRPGLATAAAEKALAHSQLAKVRFLAARIFVEADDLVRARRLALALAAELQVAPQAYARIIEGEAALKEGKARDAIRALTEANALLDIWIGRFDLGRAYLAGGALIQADSEFDSCIKRRGEVLALFLDEEPTFGYLPPVYYYQGRVREALKTAGFADSYRKYLSIREKSAEDPLVPDVRRRIGG